MLKSSSLKLKRGRPYEDIHHTCSIQFLDETDSLSVTYQKETKGQFIVDYACQHLDLVEKDYFGLYYQDTDRQRTWLDATKTVQKQLKGLHSPSLYFAVKFYPSDPSKLKEEITRYQLYLQLKKDLQNGSLLCTTDEAVKLSGYIIQSELGDYDPDDHLPDYISQIKNLPPQAKSHDKELVRLHKTLAGQNPAEAEGNFVQEASLLGAYGMVPHDVVDVKGNNMHLGISGKGIATFQNGKKTHIFRWPQIKRFTFDGRMFIIKLFTIDPEDSTLLMKRSQTSCGFKCPSNAAAKKLWKCAIEQQCFFNLKTGADAPKVASSSGLFSRGSKYRFSGRSEKEVYSSAGNITRAEPRFTRAPSNAELARTYSSLRSATLPASWRQQQQQREKEEQDKDRSTSPSLKNHLAVDLERSLDESGFYPSGPTLSDEVFNSVATPEGSNFSPGLTNGGGLGVTTVADVAAYEVEEEEEEEEEVCCSVKHPRCGEHEHTIPHLNFYDHDPDCPTRQRENGYEVLDDMEVCERDVAASLESQMINAQPLTSTAAPKLDSASRLSSLTHDLDAQIADLRSRLETDLDAPEPVTLVNGARKPSNDFEVIVPTKATQLRHRPPASPGDEAVTITSAERKTAPTDSASPKKEEDKKPDVAKRQTRSWFPGWKFFLALLLLSILIVAVLVFEIQADYPVITDLRMMPEVEALRREYYLPYRQATIDFVNQYVG